VIFVFPVRGRHALGQGERRLAHQRVVVSAAFAQRRGVARAPFSETKECDGTYEGVGVARMPAEGIDRRLHRGRVTPGRGVRSGEVLTHAWLKMRLRFLERGPILVRIVRAQAVSHPATHCIARADVNAAQQTIDRSSALAAQ
jgi:hypothetical protein